MDSSRRWWLNQDTHQRCQLDGCLGLPGGAFVDHLGFVQAVDGLGQRIVVGVPVLPTDGLMPASPTRMIDQLRLAKTRVLIFEEASHLVEPGARGPPRAAGDWFKSVADELTQG